MVGHRHTQTNGQMQGLAPWPGASGALRRGPAGARLAGLLLAGALLIGTGCGVSDEGTLPPDVQDPATLKTPSGALARYRGALAALGGAVDGALFAGGLLTDELAAVTLSLGSFGPYTALDGRQEGLSFSPARLHRLRSEAHEARGFLATYAPDSSPALRGHLYAVEGYAEIFLADLFCSGIPLSTVDFDGNYTLAPGSTTTQVYEHALALFDTALGLTGDSVRLQQLAAVGRGRALLARGRYAEAAAAVAGVPDTFAYQTAFAFQLGTTSGAPDSALLWWHTTHSEAGAPSMADREGGTGLPYRTSGDPRTRDSLLGNIRLPRKYATTSSPVRFTVASGVEARLIEAEAVLQGGGAWLTTLNALRTDGTFHTVPTEDPNDAPALVDTIWHAGGGGVDSLGPLADPGAVLAQPAADSARVDLLFRERAFWLYLTAHRQGDLRRLIRQYPRRTADNVYPTGSYPGGRGTYGAEVVVPMPETERILNPLYTGCITRNP